MEEETAATTFWCHTCSQIVTPVDIKCPFCLSGFLEEMQQEEEEQQRDSNVWRPDIPVWASLLMEMTNNSARNQTVETENETEHRGGGGGDYMESRLQEMLRRRGRRPVCVEQLLLGIRAGLTLAPAAADDNNQERGRVIVTNPHNQIVAVSSSAVSDTLPPVVAGSLSEYFIGPKFEALLETLTETDPRRCQLPIVDEETNEMMKNSPRNGTTDMDSQLQEILRRRGRRPVSVEQLLQGIRTGLILAVPGSAVSDTLPPVAGGSLSEYFIGPEFEAMLETLTETDPRRYGTPPARRDAVEALADVIILLPGLQCLKREETYTAFENIYPVLTEFRKIQQ
ncbi:unnamed protein product [Brassica napus]|uniref:RING-type E3 ubiquitin transferase n=1 Tax=Brassica napus TaxID=3708 RepID=A0A816Q0K5_BRANA|nr:unnamed protein product [Brassica napus]